MKTLPGFCGLCSIMLPRRIQAAVEKSIPCGKNFNPEHLVFPQKAPFTGKSSMPVSPPRKEDA